MSFNAKFGLVAVSVGLLTCATAVTACSGNGSGSGGASTGTLSSGTQSTGSQGTAGTAGTAGTGSAGSGICGVCPGGQVCDATLGCVECLTNATCAAMDPGNPICTGGRCRECGVSADCGLNQTCSAAHVCQPTCTSNMNCQQGGGGNNTPLCDTVTGQCVQCVTVADCPQSPLCSSGLCADCAWLKRVTSSRDQRFYLCGRSLSDPRFGKYPVLPVLTCTGFDAVSRGFRIRQVP